MINVIIKKICIKGALIIKYFKIKIKTLIQKIKMKLFKTWIIFKLKLIIHK